MRASISAENSLGGASGFTAVFLARAAASPMFFGTRPLVAARVAAVTIAVLISALLQLASRATTPAGAATAIVVAIGLETASWTGVRDLVVGIALVTALGEAARQLILRAQRA